jgi:transcriptional regulator GlxA family with amidase domain
MNVQSPSSGQPIRICIALFPDAEELDWAGPWEVLASWARHWPQDGVEVFTVAQMNAPIRCANGLRVLPDHSWKTAPPIDVLVYPGGEGASRLVGDEKVRGWVRGLAKQGALITSVCTGAFVLADAGLLDNRAATTHWEETEKLRSLGHGIQIRDRDRFVDTGQVITAAGVSAGIDMALYLVSRLHSPERARAVRRDIQYDPDPPI